MPSLRLTRQSVYALPFTQSGQTFYRDTLLPGFGLRVGRQSKVYFAEGQVERRSCRVGSLWMCSLMRCSVPKHQKKSVA